MLMLLAKSDVSVLTALGYSAIGMVLIMAVLTILMGCIYALSAVIKKTESKNISLNGLFKKLFKKEAPTNEAVTSTTPEENKSSATVAPGSAGDIKLNGVPEATAAMAMAIVADELKTPINELHFISIKEVKE